MSGEQGTELEGMFSQQDLQLQLMKECQRASWVYVWVLLVTRQCEECAKQRQAVCVKYLSLALHQERVMKERRLLLTMPCQTS